MKKDSTNNIYFYPFNERTAMFAPKPIPASKALPEWYKSQPATLNEEEFIAKGMSSSTIKRCMPIFDYITAGYVISIPCDIYIDATNPDKIEWSVPLPMKTFANDMISTHAPEQYSHYPTDRGKYHKQLFRIMPFWSVKTDPGYSTLFMHPTHKDPVPFLAIGGLIDTDQFISDGHLSMFIEKDFKGVIKQGTPFVQVIPIKRENWQMNILEPVEANKEVMAQRLNLRSTFVAGYKNKMRSKKEFK
jgi:hypothetical protein